MTLRDVVIIGSGPAGLTAALYASRARLNVLCIAGYEAGGQLMLTTDVENYPGFPEGILGPEMMEKFRKQAERFGTEFVDRNATSVDLMKRPFVVDVEGERVEARSVIVATGASARWLKLPSEQRLRGHGISTCATCDGAFFRERKIVVVGGGDSAMEESLFLTRFASHVTVVHRRDEFRASKIMQERVLAHPKISVLWNTELVDYVGKDHVEAVRVLTHDKGKPARTHDLPCDGVFIAIGHDPNTSIFKGKLKLDAAGYIEVHDRTRTSVDGVFCGGDVHDHRYRQAVTAAGMGCMAAMDAERWLDGHRSAE